MNLPKSEVLRNISYHVFFFKIKICQPLCQNPNLRIVLCCVALCCAALRCVVCVCVCVVLCCVVLCVSRVMTVNWHLQECYIDF
jgi:hypothetical protein